MNKKTNTKSALLFVVIAVVFIISVIIAFFSCAQVFDFSIGGSENMRILNELNAEWVLDDSLVIESSEVHGVPYEWLHAKQETPKKAILQLHGGAYIRSLNYRENLYQRMAEQYAKISGAGVMTIDYRIAPENPYPAALEDAQIGYQHLLDMGYDASDILVVGDSAGGGLALALTLYLRDNQRKLPSAVITMSAWTDLTYRRKPAYVGDNDAKNPYISPAYGDYTGFPPMLMQVGTKDIKNDTISIAQKARDCGVDVTQTTYDNMPHVFQALFPVVNEANVAWNEVADFIADIVDFKESLS